MHVFGSFATQGSAQGGTALRCYTQSTPEGVPDIKRRSICLKKPLSHWSERAKTMPQGRGCRDLAKPMLRLCSELYALPRLGSIADGGMEVKVLRTVPALGRCRTRLRRSSPVTM